MKKILIFLVVLIICGSVLAAMTYNDEYYRKHRQAALSGSTKSDPIYLFMDETEDIIGLGKVYLTPGSVPDPCSEGDLYYDDTGNNIKYYNGILWITLGNTSAGTSLDGSYDLGSGITVDAGAVTLTTSAASNSAALAIVHGETGNYAGMTLSNASAYPGIQITTTGAGADITGTSATWSVSAAGAVTCVGIDTTGTLIMENDEIISNATNDVILFNSGSEDLTIDLGTGDNKITLGSNSTSATEIATGDFVTLSGLTTITGTAADFTLGITADATGEDLIITQAGAVDGSIQLLSAGTGADAIDIETSAGGISIASTGNDIVIDATDKSVKFDCGEASADDGIVLVTTGAGSGIQITSLADIDITTTGASGEDISITNTGGSVIITATEAADDAMVLDASTAGAGMQITSGADIDITTTGASGEDITITNTGGSVIIAATEAITDAIFLDASTAGAGIDITSGEDIDIATTGAAGEDISIINTGGSVIVRGTEDIADAIYIHASTGGIDITADGAAAKDLDLACTSGSTNISGGEAAADAVTIAAAAGGIDITSAATFDIDITATGGTIQAIASEAAANQFKVDAQGAVAGYAIVLETTNGGVQINADGADNGDISIDAADDLTLTAGGDLVLAVTGSITGNIQSNGTSTLIGYARGVEVEAGTAEQLLVTDSGKVFVNTAAQGATTFTLPDAAAGLWFTFVDNSATGTDDVIIDCASGDNINHDTNGDAIQNTEDEAAASITLIAIDGTTCITMCSYGTWTAQ